MEHVLDSILLYYIIYVSLQCYSETEEEKLAIVTQKSPLTLSSKLKLQLKQKMSQLHDELLRYSFSIPLISMI